MKRKTARQVQADFFARASGDLSLMAEVFDTLDCVTFNILDADDRIIAYSRSNCVKCNFENRDAIIGKTCHELFPKVDADVYVKRNRLVRQTGRPVVNMACHTCGDRSLDREIVSIFPVRDRKGRVIGTTAVHRRLENTRDEPEGYGAINRALDYIREHFAERITLAKLAEISQMGTFSFSHAFKRIMEMTPGDYITTIRLNHARKMLEETDVCVLAIALECGFYDQSHFIRTFRKHRNKTPTAYRLKFREQIMRGQAPTKASP